MILSFLEDDVIFLKTWSVISNSAKPFVIDFFPNLGVDHEGWGDNA